MCYEDTKECVGDGILIGCGRRIWEEFMNLGFGLRIIGSVGFVQRTEGEMLLAKAYRI